MVLKAIRLLLAGLLMITSGCSLPGMPPFAEPSATPPAAQTEAYPEPYPAPSATPAQPPEANLTPGSPGDDTPVTLRVWLPPEFDPNAGSLAGALLRARLQEFSARRPNVRLEIRIKALDGPGGMINALSTASTAAPLALPDLVALPRPLLEEAALKGLLRPIDAQQTTLEDPDWYGFAFQMAHLQNSAFGLPFAGDALALAYRPEQLTSPPRTWDDLAQLGIPLAFPAADPDALTTLAFYLGAGGEIQDDQGRPWLDSQVLTDVFSLYQRSGAAGVMPLVLSQWETDAQSWASFEGGLSGMAVTWTSRLVQAEIQFDSEQPEAASLKLGAAPLPMQGRIPYTLVTGWVWALAGSHPDRQVLALELAEFLTESGFLARWSEAAGLIPARVSALDAWQDESHQRLLEQVALSAHLIPSADVLSSLAPLLKEATIAVLKEQGDPFTLAEAAAAALDQR